MVAGRVLGQWLAASVGATLLLCGCQPIRAYLAQVNQRSWTEYHASRWQAVLAACAGGAPYNAPEQPAAPRCCAAVEQAYPGVVEAWTATQRSLQESAAQCAVEEEYLAQLLEVVELRDRKRLAGLADQLPLYEQRLQDAQDRLAESLHTQQAKVRELKAAWEEVWSAAAGQELDFDLAAGVERARRDGQPLTPARETELREYYRQHYARLAMVYLDYIPDFKPLPAEQAPPPPGCGELSEALAGYERGLRLRYDINQALDADLSRLMELAGFDPAVQPWPALTFPAKGWPRQRTESALARLKLLGRADGLLAGCLDFQQAWLSEAWLRVWPGCPLETNLFAYAGLSILPAAPPALANWQDLTFRK